MSLLIFQLLRVPMNLHIPPEQIPVCTQTAFRNDTFWYSKRSRIVQFQLHRSRNTLVLSGTYRKTVSYLIIPTHTPPPSFDSGGQRLSQSWASCFWNLVWQWGSLDASDSRLKQFNDSEWLNLIIAALHFSRLVIFCNFASTHCQRKFSWDISDIRSFTDTRSSVKKQFSKVTVQSSNSSDK